MSEDNDETRSDPRGDLRARIVGIASGAYIKNNVLTSHQISTDAAYLAAAREALIAAKERFECDVSCRAWMTDIIDDFLAELNRDADGH